MADHLASPGSVWTRLKRGVALLLTLSICVGLPRPAEAAILTFTGFESALAGTEFLGAGITGTGSISSAQAHTGTYAFRSNPTTTAVGWASMGQSISAGTGRGPWDAATTYIDFWFYAATLPSANNEPIGAVVTSASGLKLEIRITNGGILLAYAADGTTLLATGTTALSTGQWYWLSITCGTSATVGAYEVRIGGVSEFSGTGNTSATNGARFFPGKTTNRNGETVDFYYDDVIVSNSAYVGDTRVAVAQPTGNGSTMQWTAGTNGSDYLEVDEVPADDGTTYVASSTAGSQVALFAMQDSGTIGASGTIHAVLGQVRIAESVSETSSCSIRIRSGSTNSDGDAVDTSAVAYGTSVRLLETDPNTSSAWTTSGIDGIELGAIQNSINVQRMTTAQVMVAYTPSGAPTPVPRGLLLGVAHE